MNVNKYVNKYVIVYGTIYTIHQALSKAITMSIMSLLASIMHETHCKYLNYVTIHFLPMSLNSLIYSVHKA